MKKFLIIIACMAAVSVMSAQVNFTAATDFAEESVTVTAKTVITATVPAASPAICAQGSAIVITVWQDAAKADPALTLTAGSGIIPGVVKTAASLPASVTNPAVCAAVYNKYVWTIPAGTFTASGTYTLSLNRTDDACTDGTTTYSFTIATPIVPTLAFSDATLCAGEEMTITATFTDSPAWDETPELTLYYKVASDCGGATTWVEPTTVGLPATMIIPANDSGNVGEATQTAGAPGKFYFHVNRMQYTLDGCGLITISNPTQE